MTKDGLLLCFLVASLTVAGMASADPEAGRPFSTMLSGAEEVGPGGTLGVGDPDGTGFASITINQGQGEICFEITVANLDEPVTRGHIHAAPAGSNGPIVVEFVEPGETPTIFVNGIATGCAPADEELIKDIRHHPENYYVNVHNVTFPAGAVRGQLEK